MKDIPVTLYELTPDGRRFSYTLNAKGQLLSFELKGELYTLYKRLGNGSFGKVYLFRHQASDKRLAVKMPLQVMEETQDSQDQAQIQREFDFLKEIYGREGFFHLIFSRLPVNSEAREKYWIYYMIMPYFEGIQLAKALAAVRSERELVSTYLAIALALDQIHREHRIVHGDSHGGNFIVDSNLCVHIIDWAYAAYIGQEIIAMEAVMPEDYDKPYAPETWIETEEKMEAHPLQDIYAFGSTVRLNYAYNTRWIKGVDGSLESQADFYPSSFLRICHQALDVERRKRPPFNDIINTLKDNLKARPPQTAIRLNPLPLELGHTNLFVGLEPCRLSNKFKSSSGFDNRVFNSSLGKLRVKFFKHPVETGHADAILHLRNIYPQEAACYQYHHLQGYPTFIQKRQEFFFHVLPYYEGVSLAQYPFKNKSESKVARVGLAIFKELQRLEDLGYVGGRLKPENIIIDDSKPGLPKIRFTQYSWEYIYHMCYEQKTSRPKSPAKHWTRFYLSVGKLNKDSKSFQIIQDYCKQMNVEKCREPLHGMQKVISALTDEIARLKSIEEKAASLQPRALANTLAKVAVVPKSQGPGTKDKLPASGNIVPSASLVLKPMPHSLQLSAASNTAFIFKCIKPAPQKKLFATLALLAPAVPAAAPLMPVVQAPQFRTFQPVPDSTLEVKDEKHEKDGKEDRMEGSASPPKEKNGLAITFFHRNEKGPAESEEMRVLNALYRQKPKKSVEWTKHMR